MKLDLNSQIVVDHQQHLVYLEIAMIDISIIKVKKLKPLLTILKVLKNIALTLRKLKLLRDFSVKEQLALMNQLKNVHPSNLNSLFHISSRRANKSIFVTESQVTIIRSEMWRNAHSSQMYLRYPLLNQFLPNDFKKLS